MLPADQTCLYLGVMAVVKKNVPLIGRFFLQALIPSCRISEPIFEKRYKSLPSRCMPPAVVDSAQVFVILADIPLPVDSFHLFALGMF